MECRVRELEHGGEAGRMDIQCHKEDGVAVLVLAGSLEARAIVEFDEVGRELVEAQAYHVVVDLEQLALLTSAGIREFVKLRNRLDGLGRRLVLCALSEPVATALEISGFRRHFTIEVSREAALKRVACDVDGAERGPSGSRVSRLVLSLLTGEALSYSERQAASGGSLSPMAGELAALLFEGIEGEQDVGCGSDSSKERPPSDEPEISGGECQNNSGPVTES
jgi:anti-anti-sigma factor